VRGFVLGPRVGVVGASGVQEGAGEVSGDDVSACLQPWRGVLICDFVGVGPSAVAVGGAGGESGVGEGDGPVGALR